jgi:hypothetical protein
MYQRKQKKDEGDDANMTPYEKWMRNEENKARDSQMGSMAQPEMQNPMFAANVSQNGAMAAGANGSTHNPMAQQMQGMQQNPQMLALGQMGDTSGQLNEPMPGDMNPYDQGAMEDQYAEQAFDQDFVQPNMMQNPQMMQQQMQMQGGAMSPGGDPMRRSSLGPANPMGTPQGNMGGAAAAGTLPPMRRPSAAQNPLRAAGRRGSAISVGGRPNSDAAAAFMARKKRQSRTDM